jgi:hypothetical protein
MSGAPERKYTDADVRSDPELAELALDYLDNYTGDFDPLVRAQETLERGSLLTTTQTRVVLNCMRHDWSIADQLPQPMAKVIDMPVRDETIVKPKRKKEPKWTDRTVPCGRTEIHLGHNYEKDDYKHWHCRGISNNRQDYFWIPARIKVPYAKARGGKMVHLVNLEGDSNFKYMPNRYGDGYGSGYESKSIPKLWGFSPRLSVDLLCRYPSWLENPMLLAEIPEGMLTPQGQPIGLCPHCEKVRDGEG